MSVKPGARQSYLLAGAALTVLGMASCSSSSDSDPTTLPTLPPSTSTASAVPSVSPSETGKKAELAAATAVVKRYYAVANDLRNHMDAAALAALMTASCPCQEQVRAVRLAARKDEHYIDQAHINEFVPSAEGPSAAFVLVDLNASRGGLRTSNGQVVTSAPAAKHVKRVFRLVESKGRWLISRIEALS